MQKERESNLQNLKVELLAYYYLQTYYPVA